MPSDTRTRQTAEQAADEARRLAKDLIIEPDAIAVIVRDNEGKYHVHTSHHPVGAGASWGMFWGLLFGLLFFVPVFGIAIGAGIGALMGKVTKSGIDSEFQDQVRGMLKPGTSALFLMVEKVTPDKATEALEQVRRHRAEVLAVQGRRGRAAGRPARPDRLITLTRSRSPLPEAVPAARLPAQAPLASGACACS